jgi:hypothetical protein
VSKYNLIVDSFLVTKSEAEKTFFTRVSKETFELLIDIWTKEKYYKVQHANLPDPITSGNLSTLYKGNWLNDEVIYNIQIINTYLKLL